jgi:hypothetical protein
VACGENHAHPRFFSAGIFFPGFDFHPTAKYTLLTAHQAAPIPTQSLLSTPAFLKVASSRRIGHSSKTSVGPFPFPRIREIAHAILSFPTAAMLLVAFWLYVTRNRRDF